MATYQLIKQEDGYNTYIVKPANILERLKMALYVVLYPDKTPVLMVVPEEWADTHIENDLSENDL
jgi:hypothetical protein